MGATLPREHRAPVSSTRASSRTSRKAAGWEGGEPGGFLALMSPYQPRFSWLRPSVLWRSRNDVLIRRFGDPTDEERKRWVKQRLAEGAPADFRIDRTDLAEPKLIVLGDPGEGDASQFAVVPGLLREGGDTDLMVICSDVIYPCGDADEYEDKFYWPYKDYPAPIYALPGNHDWYDGLAGFMLNFCGSRAERRDHRKLLDVSRWRNMLRNLLWRRPGHNRLGSLALLRGQTLRSQPGQTPDHEHRQPGPYWAMETGPVVLVSIDTGIRGAVDDDQLRWLREISASSPKPKILLTGKPLIVNGKPAGEREYFEALDAIVRDPAHRYIAAIGGDTHNYQRYPVKLTDGRTIQYIVSGAGGAYTKATHLIPIAELEGCNEDDCRLYPRRGDSLSLYSGLYDRRLAFGSGLLRLDPDQAARLVSERLEGDSAPVRAAGIDRISLRARIAAKVVYPLPTRLGFQRYLSEFFDWDEPPFFKSFLRLDITHDVLRIRCFAATGWREQEEEPPLEDDLTVPLNGAGA